MKLIEMRCPNCDAPLSVNADRDEAFCRHCNTTFLIEDASKAKSRDRVKSIAEPAARQQSDEEFPGETAVEFETAKSESPEKKRLSGVVTMPGDKPDTNSAKKETNHGPLTVIAAVLLLAIIASVGTCGTQSPQSNASSNAHSASGNAATYGNASGTATALSNTASAVVGGSEAAPTPSVTAASEASESAASVSSGSQAIEDGFPCDLDSTATFSGVTIPIDSSWKDNSPAWDWRHKTFSYTAGAASMEDVQVSISTFTGGDTKSALAFMKDYADFAPIYLDFGEYSVRSADERDGVTYTRIEGVNSSYESAFNINPPSKYSTIREMYADKVVRCVCLVGYAENGTGFAVSIALHGSADNGECIFSANKILDGVSFVPAECNTDSTDLWLYEVQH